MLLAEQLFGRPELRGKAFNFSNETEVTVMELVHRIVKAMGTELEPLILNEATCEIPRQSLCATRARSLLGWSPLFTLDEGLERTIAWYREFLA
jgi:CDP-glucose 4,6-dehydratase